MLRVLFVDDEAFCIERLKTVVDWHRLGFEVCGACNNGSEALALIETLNPDVVITEIRMPVMDGLDLIEHVKNKDRKKIKFIILSGYAQFEYAQKALKYGVKHYLLKPILEEDMNCAINDLKREIVKSEKDQSTDFEDKRLATSGIIRSIICKNYSDIDISSLNDILLNNSSIKEWHYILVKIIPAGNTMFEDLIKKNECLYVVCHGKNLYGLLFGIVDVEYKKMCIDKFIASLYCYLTKTINASFYIGVGESFTQASQMEDSYNSSLRALEHCFYNRHKSVTFYSSIKDRKLNYIFEETEYVNKIINAIDEFDYSKVKSVIEDAFSYYKESFLAPEIVKMYVVNIIYRGIELIQNAKGSVNNLIQKYNINEIEKSNNTIIELEMLLKGFCENCCNDLYNLNKSKKNDNAYRIEVYIEQNYKKSITIKEMSKYLYMHPAYLGRLFTQKFGMGFNEYLHKLRIEEAKRLLEETEMKTYEIAQEIGYSNYNIFLQYFTKYTGEKPVEYKQIKNKV